VAMAKMATSQSPRRTTRMLQKIKLTKLTLVKDDSLA